MIHSQPDGRRTEVLPRVSAQTQNQAQCLVRPVSITPGLACGPLSLPSKPRGRCLIRSARIGVQGLRLCEGCAAPLSSPTRLPSCYAGYAAGRIQKKPVKNLIITANILDGNVSPADGGGARRRKRERASDKNSKSPAPFPPTRPARRRS